jgi:hypothetical protein
MNSQRSSPMSWILGLGCILLAALLLVYYVNLLQGAVARGSQVKYAQQEQRTAPAKTAVRNLVSDPD